MSADGLFDTGVVEQWPQLLGDKVDKKFSVKLLQLEVTRVLDETLGPFAQQVTLRRAEFNLTHDGAFSVKGVTTAGLQ